jgi:antitoxin component YwqK of YwqJK toxin-antitoxin module
MRGKYLNGKKEGTWVQYFVDGTIDKEETGTFKNGKKISD